MGSGGVQHYIKEGGLPAEGPLPWQRLPEYKTIVPHLQRKVNGFSDSL